MTPIEQTTVIRAMLIIAEHGRDAAIFIKEAVELGSLSVNDLEEAYYQIQDVIEDKV